MSDASIPAAFGGGLISFLSPCVLPIVPGYLSVVSGLTVAEVREGSREHLLRIAATTGLFVAGFSSVFILLGLGASSVGNALYDHQEALTRISGVLVLLMAIYIAGSQLVMAPGLYREVRFHPRLERYGVLAAPIAGMAFGLGWTPCIGPTLSSVLTIAARDGELSRGALLLAVYSAGLGVPFLLSGLAFGKLTRVFDWVKRHYLAVTLVSAGVMAFFGVVLLLDRFDWLRLQVTDFLELIGLRRLTELG